MSQWKLWLNVFLSDKIILQFRGRPSALYKSLKVLKAGFSFRPFIYGRKLPHLSFYELMKATDTFLIKKLYSLNEVIARLASSCYLLITFGRL